TANFDAGKTAALAITLAEWLAFGSDHAATMVESATRLATELAARGVAVVTTPDGHTASHALAIDASSVGGGSALAERLRRANLLTSAIGLPTGLDAGLRVGVNELVRLGAGPGHMAEVADLLAAAIDTDQPEALAPRTTELRRRFDTVAYTL
ncbi:MAG: serine hydroxymethyltransferase, partial [Actinomycetota bacterium]